MATLCPTGFIAAGRFFCYDNLDYAYTSSTTLYFACSGVSEQFHTLDNAVEIVDKWKQYLDQRQPYHARITTLEVKLDTISAELCVLKEEIRELLNMIKYAPGGAIARETQAHFEGLKAVNKTI